MRGDDTNWGVGNRAVNQGDGPNVLGAGATRGDVDAFLTVVDADSLVHPTPVPELADGCNAVVKDQVSHGKLLVPNGGTNNPSIECDVCHEPSRT